jgi:N-acetylglucosamine kinase-like BadF-type ATPase
MRVAAAMTASAPVLALGLDAGGTATRWALADAAGAIRAEGEVGALSGLLMLGGEGHDALAATLDLLARALPLRPQAVWAGVTGLDPVHADAFAQRLAASLGTAPGSTHACSDIELLCRAAFPGGEGIVLYAGTGSIAALRAADGTLQRAGGRGALIDDAGGGHWIACQALRQVWRAEDDTPGVWQASPLARRLFERLGGADWASTRAGVYGAKARGRGELGRLALAVAEAVPEDAAARQLLEQAGRELARLVLALFRRCGSRPVGLAGRVFDLHPLVEVSLVAALPAGAAVHRLATPAHHAAARLALTRLGVARSAA